MMMTIIPIAFVTSANLESSDLTQSCALQPSLVLPDHARSFALFIDDTKHELDLGVVKNLVTYAVEVARYFGHANEIDSR